MNIYFLVEGKRTERKVYPKWLSILIPELVEVKYFDEALQNNYYIFSGNGYPSLLHNHLRNCVDEINALNCYNEFVVCLDADEDTIEDRKMEVLTFMKNENICLNPNINFTIIVQNRCIETWFLGNTKLFKKNPNSEILRDYIRFYDVSKNDPEQMGKIGETQHAQFHHEYLQELFVERNLSYSKNNPKEVVQAYFLAELVKRAAKTKHLQTFQSFLDFCTEIRHKIQSNDKHTHTK